MEIVLFSNPALVQEVLVADGVEPKTSKGSQSLEEVIAEIWGFIQEAGQASGWHDELGRST